MLTSSGYFIDGYFLQTSWQEFSNSDESLFYDGKNQEIGHSTIISKQNKKTIPRVSVATLFMLEAWLIATSSTLVYIPLKGSRLTIMHLLIEYSARILEGFFLMCLGTHPGTHSFLIYCILNYFAESILQILALMRTLKLQQVCTI